MKNKNKNKNLGFTLLEMILSLAMVAIVVGSVLQVASFSETHKSLTIASNEFRAVLRTAQSAALSIPNPETRHVCGYGVYVSNVANGEGLHSNYELYYTYVDEGDFQNDPNSCSNDENYRSYNTAGLFKETFQSFSLTDDLEFSTQVGQSIFFSTPYSEVYGNAGQRLAGEVTYTIINNNNAATRTTGVNEFGRIQ